MAVRAIIGATIITLSDQYRARWTSGLKCSLAILAVIFAGMSLQYIPRSPMTPVEIAISAFAAVATVALFILFYLVLVILLVTLFSLRMSKEQRDISYVIDESGLVLRDKTGAAITAPWTVVRRAREDRRAFRLAMKPMGERYIPKRAFAADEVAALRALIAEKLGAKAKLRKA